MTFERRTWIVLDAIVLVLILLSARLVYWQMVRGDDLLPGALAGGENLGLKKVSYDDPELRGALSRNLTVENLQNLPQPVVQRLSDLLETIRRGSIYDRNGRLLAADRMDTEGIRTRFYTEPTLAHVIGSVSGLRVGISGVEGAYNDTLLGLDRPDASFDRMVHRPVIGSDLVLTVDSALQRQAEAALEGRAGSILVLDGQSGAILAMASLPRFDPNRVLEPGYLPGLIDGCDGSPQCSGILLNRATQALYSPGSTWKTVTLIAALDSGQVAPGQVFDFGEPVQGPGGPYFVYEVDGGVIPDPNHSERRLDLEMSFAKSANAAFARIGAEMPAEVLIDYAARLGFSAPQGKRFPLEFDFSPALLAAAPDSLHENNLLRAATAIGQGELLTSPLNMGMVLLAVLNGGDLPLPYLVDSVQNPAGGATARQPERRVVPDIMQPETAQLVRGMLETVVAQGSGRQAAVDGLLVGGKTGTAQLGGGLSPHAWFTGFAEEGGRSVVVVVVVENGGEGAQTAAPIFAHMAASAMRHAGEAVVEVVPTPVEPSPTPEPTPEPTATPTPEVAPATELPPEPSPTPLPTPTIPGVPPPDIPYDPSKVDFTEQGSASCPGNQEGPLGSGKFIWPTVYQGLSGGPFQEGHPGIDLSTPRGTPVYAADAGLVIFAGWSGLGYGNTVVIDHGNGFKTLYAHLSQVSQYCGAKVQSGKLIGMSGDTGNSSGPHLHFEVRVPGGYLDPLKVLPVP